MQLSTFAIAKLDTLCGDGSITQMPTSGMRPKMIIEKEGPHGRTSNRDWQAWRLSSGPKMAQKGAPSRNILLSQGRELSHASKFVELLHFPCFFLQNMNVYWSYPAPIIRRARGRDRGFVFLLHSVSWGLGAHCFAGGYGMNVCVPAKGMATHSRILAWRIPWIEKPGGL